MKLEKVILNSFKLSSFLQLRLMIFRTKFNTNHILFHLLIYSIQSKILNRKTVFCTCTRILPELGDQLLFNDETSDKVSGITLKYEKKFSLE